MIKDMKVIYTAHGFHFYKGGSLLSNFIYQSLESIAGEWTDYLVVINEEDEIAAKQKRLVNGDKVVFMPGIGVDTNSYVHHEEKVASAHLWNELNLPHGTPFFLVIAEFAQNKRHSDVLKAFARLDGSDNHLVLAGSGPLMGQVRTLAHSLGVLDRVHFLGFRDDISTWIDASSAVILASRREGLPRSLMEALCLETPCIGSNIRGNRDLLSNDCGILVDVGDIDGYKRAMEFVISQPEKCRQMVVRGRSKVERYDIRKIINLHESLYEQAIGF